MFSVMCVLEVFADFWGFWEYSEYEEFIKTNRWTHIEHWTWLKLSSSMHLGYVSDTEMSMFSWRDSHNV